MININMKTLEANDERLTVELVENKEPMFISKDDISRFFIQKTG